MNFQTIHTAIVTLLGTEAGGNYRVLGYRNTPEDAENIRNTNATVAVYFKRAVPVRKSNSLTGPFDHECTYIIELKISTPAEADLATLNDPVSTPTQRATAMGNIENTKALANTALGVFIAAVFADLMDARNVDLGLAKGVARSRRIEAIETEEPGYIGDLIISEATMNLVLTTEETVTGDEGVESDAIDLSIKVNDEPSDGQAGFSKGL